jgi:CDP-diacylglycerol--serine O-phosphatidyltransferase
MDRTQDRAQAMSRRHARRKRMVAVIPSLLTLGNAACGFASITYAAKLDPEALPPNDPFFFAALLIFAAMVFDGLDGPIARLAKQTSDFGGQLDSLSDAISFGVAPAFLMLKFSRVNSDVFHPRLLWIIAVLYMLCVILRLARFNVAKDGEASHEFFRGLPSPAAAGMVASLVIIAPGLVQLQDPGMSDASRRLSEFLLASTSTCLPMITLIVACLMVSNVRYPHAANQLLRGKKSFQHLVKLIFTIVVVLAIHELAIPIVFFYFVLTPPLRSLWSRVVFHRTSPLSSTASN